MAKRISQNQFRVVVERDADGYVVVSVPALPGSSTQAKTMNELRERLRDAIRLSLEVARVNPRYRKRITWFAYKPACVGMEVLPFFISAAAVIGVAFLFSWDTLAVFCQRK